MRLFTLNSFCFILKETLDFPEKSVCFNSQDKICTFSHNFLNNLPLKCTKNQTKLLNIQIAAVINNKYMYILF